MVNAKRVGGVPLKGPLLGELAHRNPQGSARSGPKCKAAFLGGLLDMEAKTHALS